MKYRITLTLEQYRLLQNLAQRHLDEARRYFYAAENDALKFSRAVLDPEEV